MRVDLLRPEDLLRQSAAQFLGSRIGTVHDTIDTGKLRSISSATPAEFTSREGPLT
jgi:hypothetical protein